MTRFRFGPADGKVLALKRSPLFLRVTKSRYGDPATFDALDQLDDTPEPGEDVFAYRLAADHGNMHLSLANPRRGMWCRLADYDYYPDQPPDAVLRDTRKWQSWALERAHAENQAKKPTDGGTGCAGP